MDKCIGYYYNIWKRYANSDLKGTIKVLEDTFHHEPSFHSFLFRFSLVPSLARVAHTQMPEDTLGLSAPPACHHRTLNFLTVAQILSFVSACLIACFPLQASTRKDGSHVCPTLIVVFLMHIQHAMVLGTEEFLGYLPNDWRHYVSVWLCHKLVWAWKSQ